MKRLSRLSSIKSSGDIEFDRKCQDYLRGEAIRDASTKIICLAIYVLPVVFILLFGVLIWHDISKGNWESIKSYGVALGGGLIGYLSSELRKSGLGNK